MSDLYMPDELWTKILTFLPAKSLVRLASVCKSWKSLITSSDFITDHLNETKLSNSINNNHLILVRYYPGTPKKERYSLHFDDETFDLHQALNSPFHMLGLKYNRHRVIGSCNGLICLSDDITLKPTLMLWNPSIRKSFTLPRRQFRYWIHDQVFGFGFDSRSNDYKVVMLVLLDTKRNMFPVVKLYKLSTGCWETIYATFDPSYSFNCNRLGEAFVNGAVHWRVTKRSVGSLRRVTKRSAGSLILSFNLSDEEFCDIMPPANLYMEEDFLIAVNGEWLSLFHNSDENRCSVWAMKEYGVVESWTKLYTLDLNGELEYPLGFRKNGELILARFNGDLVSYESETQQITYLGNSYLCREFSSGADKFTFNVEAYVESLVLFGDANGLGRACDASNEGKEEQALSSNSGMEFPAINENYGTWRFSR